MLGKTLWEKKEVFHVTSIRFFSKLFSTAIKMYFEDIETFTCFTMDKKQEELKTKASKLITRWQNFRLVQIGTNCRRHFNSLPNDRISDLSKLKAFADKINDLKTEICLWKGKKYFGKRRKCCLPAFSPFPAMFSKLLFFRVVKGRDCVEKS